MKDAIYIPAYSDGLTKMFYNNVIVQMVNKKFKLC